MQTSFYPTGNHVLLNTALALLELCKRELFSQTTTTIALTCSLLSIALPPSPLSPPPSLPPPSLSLPLSLSPSLPPSLPPSLSPSFPPSAAEITVFDRIDQVLPFIQNIPSRL